MSEPKRNEVQVFFAWLLIVAGALIGGLSGLCTAVGLVVSVIGAGSSVREAASIAGLVVAVGFIPIVVGLGLFIAGRALLKSAGPPKPAMRVDEAP
jgi:hypothetical protein